MLLLIFGEEHEGSGEDQSEIQQDESLDWLGFICNMGVPELLELLKTCMSGFTKKLATFPTIFGLRCEQIEPSPVLCDSALMKSGMILSERIHDN